MNISEFFKQNPRIAIAFSGGVDSAYLLYEAKRNCADVIAFYVKSAFQPDFELQDAKRLADELKIKMKIIPIDVLSDERIRSNPESRCYFCKRMMFEAICLEAEKDGFSVIADGTNASDAEDNRPGMKAIRELSIRSPLKECGLTKDEIRKESEKAGLFTADKPAYACLATRIPCGTIITAEKLARTEKAESFLFSLGFRDFRIRERENCAKLEINADEIPLFEIHREMIIHELEKNYDSVLPQVEVR